MQSKDIAWKKIDSSLYFSCFKSLEKSLFQDTIPSRMTSEKEQVDNFTKDLI